jgi:hypothetical protein
MKASAESSLNYFCRNDKIATRSGAPYQQDAVDPDGTAPGARDPTENSAHVPSAQTEAVGSVSVSSLF